MHPQELAKWEEEHAEDSDQERRSLLEGQFMNMKEGLLQRKEQIILKKEETAEL
jgi:hypothetical protein